MAALNVRNVTLEQMAALAEGKTLREWVLEQLGASSVPGAVSGKVNIGPKASGVTRVKSQGVRVTRQAEGLAGSNPVAGPRKTAFSETKRCPECFAGYGHQKGCKLA